MKKNILLIGIIVMLVLILAKGVRIQSVEEYYLTHIEDITEDSETVTVSIRCDTLLKEENWKKLDKQLRSDKYVPSDGMILGETACALRKGDTAFDLLKRVCRYHEIQMEYQGQAGKKIRRWHNRRCTVSRDAAALLPYRIVSDKLRQVTSRI